MKSKHLEERTATLYLGSLIPTLSMLPVFDCLQFGLYMYHYKNQIVVLTHYCVTIRMYSCKTFCWKLINSSIPATMHCMNFFSRATLKKICIVDHKIFTLKMICVKKI